MVRVGLGGEVGMGRCCLALPGGCQLGLELAGRVFTNAQMPSCGAEQPRQLCTFVWRWRRHTGPLGLLAGLAALHGCLLDLRWAVEGEEGRGEAGGGLSVMQG